MPARTPRPDSLDLEPISSLARHSNPNSLDDHSVLREHPTTVAVPVAYPTTAIYRG
jgi:hypothetical protein